MKSKHWIIPTPGEMPSDASLSGYNGLSPLLARVLYRRGFSSPADAMRFITASEYSSDPFSRTIALKGIHGAVARIKAALKRREPIIVYGDFDADGVTSTVLLVETLRALHRFIHPSSSQGEIDRLIRPYIPHRVDEGYGLNGEALRRLARSGARLVVTVDCGIRSVEEVEEGKEARLDMIITDHHSVGPVIPAALAVINPKQVDCPYPEKMLAGVGVAFRLAEALVKSVAAERKENHWSFDLDTLLDLVAIGTVADLAPLDSEENRALVRRGLDVLNRAERPGVRALLAVAGIVPGSVSSTSIGYSLGPRINAAGRLESAMLAYNLLVTRDDSEAVELAGKLQALNVERQELTRKSQEIIRERLTTTPDLPLIWASGDFRPGIVGLVAGRLVEEYYRPAVVMEEGEHESRASCRSIPQFNITQALDACADLLVRHGGHAQAAGFTVVNANRNRLREKLEDMARNQLDGQDLRASLEIDAVVNLSRLTIRDAEDLAHLEPTGHHNPAAILMAPDVRVVDQRAVGKDGQHLKLRLARANQAPLDAIGFGFGDWLHDLPDRIDAAFHLEINVFNGQRSLQLNLQDIRPAGQR